MSVPLHPTDALILAVAATGRDATESELTEIAAHVASRGFDPNAVARVGQRGAGVLWQGRTYASNERVPNELAHFLRHAVAREEWPSGTTVAQYGQSLAVAVRDAEAGWHLSRVSGSWQLNVFAPSRQWRGTNGGAYSVVGYCRDYGWWSTGFQLDAPLAYVASRTQWQDERWLRLPALPTE